MKLFLSSAIAATLIAAPFSTAFANAKYPRNVTWYGGKFHGNLTASGERFNKNANTCASNTYKMGTLLKVTNRNNGKSVVCKVNDTGGFSKYGVDLDLSKGAFSQIAPLSAGKVSAKIEKVGFERINKAR